MQLPFVLLAALPLICAEPAAALGEDLLACPVASATPEFSRDLTDLISSGGEGQGKRDELFPVFEAMVAACLGKTGLSPDQEDAYQGYATVSIVVAQLGRDLAADGLPADLVDEILDIGPGRTNREREDISQEEVDALMAALAERGVPVDAVAEEAWAHLGAYVAMREQQGRILPALQ